MLNNKNYVIGLVIIAVLVGFAGGFYYQQSKIILPVNIPVLNQTIGKPQGVDFSMFWDTWNLIHQKYVDSGNLNTQTMIYGAIDGMVKSVGDPYTVFFQPAESKAFAEDINGSFSGIGIEIGIRNDLLTVIAPINGTPADKAGIMSGDVISKVGDKTTDGMTTDDAVNLIRGAKGTPVKLTIVRGEQKTVKEFTIIRDTIKTPTVSWKLINGNIAYVQLYVFDSNVDADFQKAADEIVKSKADRIILDVRNNPGGLLDSSVDIASYFMDPNLIVVREKFVDGHEEDYRSQANGLLKKYPLIIITNQGSASASEILTGAIKDNRHAIIVGEKTFGKGVVQEVDPLAGGASVKITIAKWYTPSGVSINTDGITPDVPVTRTEDDINANKDPQLDKAEELIQNLK
ncbi:MAG: S41 family peptidase [Minisyncoccia bacterium]